MRLVRAADHHEHQMSLHDTRFDRTDPRGPVSAKRADEDEPLPIDQLASLRRQLGSRTLEVGPAEHGQREAANPGRMSRGGATRRASFTGGFQGSASGAAPNEASRRSSGASS